MIIRASLALALAACAGPAPNTTSRTHSMVHVVRDLAQLVAHHDHTVGALAARLGTPLPEGDSPGVRIAPSDPGLRDVRITMLADGTPHTIGLTFAQPLPVADLVAAFGRYKTLERGDPDMPWPVIFPDVVRGSVADVSITTELVGPLDELDRKSTRQVALRIDRH